jgi:hypothetical protein
MGIIQQGGPRPIMFIMRMQTESDSGQDAARDTPMLNYASPEQKRPFVAPTGWYIVMNLVAAGFLIYSLRPRLVSGPPIPPLDELLSDWPAWSGALFLSLVVTVAAFLEGWRRRWDILVWSVGVLAFCSYALTMHLLNAYHEYVVWTTRTGRPFHWLSN